MYEQRMLCCVHMCEVKNSTPLVYDKLEKTSTFFHKTYDENGL